MIAPYDAVRKWPSERTGPSEPVVSSAATAQVARSGRQERERVAMQALLHGGPLSGEWREVGANPPRLLVLTEEPPTPSQATQKKVLVGDAPVPVGGWRYELADSTDGRLMYGWAQDERPELAHRADFYLGPADGVSFDVLGLTEPYSFIRMAPLERMGGVEWVQVEWCDPTTWDGESLYELLLQVAIPGALQGPQIASYRPRSVPPPIFDGEPDS